MIPPSRLVNHTLAPHALHQSALLDRDVAELGPKRHEFRLFGHGSFNRLVQLFTGPSAGQANRITVLVNLPPINTMRTGLIRRTFRPTRCVHTYQNRLYTVDRADKSPCDILVDFPIRGSDRV